MARMSREFTLVLLGAGLLTAGYFLWPDDDPARKKADAGGGGGGDNSTTGRRFTYVMIIPGRAAPTYRPAGSPGAVSRGGFGRVGGFFAGG
jgi:hypothetical protein